MEIKIEKQLGKQEVQIFLSNGKQSFSHTIANHEAIMLGTMLQQAGKQKEMKFAFTLIESPE